MTSDYYFTTDHAKARRGAEPVQPFAIFVSDLAPQPDHRIGPDGRPLPPTDLAAPAAALCLDCALRDYLSACASCPRTSIRRDRAITAAATALPSPRRPWWRRILRRKPCT